MASRLKQPQYVPDPKRVPSAIQGQPIAIRPGSGFAVMGVFVEVVRARFTEESGLDYIWNNDPKKATIAVETAFNEDKEHKNKRAAIYIDRDEQTRGRTVIGDFVGQDFKTGKKGFWALDTMPVMIECVASKKVESAIIADLTSIFLHATSDLIQAKYGFHEMTPVNVGRTQPFERDKDQWITPVTFNVQFPLRWTNTPVGPLIQQVEAKMQLAGGDPTKYFERIALGTWFVDGK